jgi:hypothetical protein
MQIFGTLQILGGGEYLIEGRHKAGARHAGSQNIARKEVDRTNFGANLFDIAVLGLRKTKQRAAALHIERKHMGI